MNCNCQPIRGHSNHILMWFSNVHLAIVCPSALCLCIRPCAEHSLSTTKCDSVPLIVVAFFICKALRAEQKKTNMSKKCASPLTSKGIVEKN